MEDVKKIWDQCLIDIQSSISQANYDTWFNGTSVYREDGGVIFLSIPNEFIKDWLKKKYHNLILKTLMSYSEGVRNVEYVISKNQNINKQTLVQSKGLPLENLYIDKENNLNPRYQFNKDFIIGPFNEVAYAVSQAIIQNPGISYNPFFIYGKTGLGKTHIIQAIGNTIKEKRPDYKIRYVPLEKFLNDYINSLRSEKVTNFKEKYRSYDVLIMDDIQFISSKEKTQEELFHLFNALYDSNRQIIFSSDMHPNFIPNLEERLKSRFASGMIVDINEPEYESKIAIIKQKMDNYKVSVSLEVIDYIASHVSGNVRELEGCLNTVVAQSQVKNKILNINEVKNILKNSIKPKKNISISEVVKIISDYYNLNEDLIFEKTRKKDVVKVRQIIMYILREEFSLSFPSIGQKLGGKDHTTVIHSCSKIKKELENNASLQDELNQLKVMFK